MAVDTRIVEQLGAHETHEAEGQTPLMNGVYWSMLHTASCHQPADMASLKC